MTHVPNQRRGRVSLVGAGPGDPGLLTLKAARRLAEADLIIYDYLVNPGHLRHAASHAQRLCVGKGFRHKKLSQDKINRRIVAAARRGYKVVRLKGGDPYLFGRGGEEALYLQSKKIAFEVVPGVTSANACAAYAGIPLTHRDHNASVTLLTGHRADDEGLDTVSWREIVGLRGTIVIYMGFYNLSKITRKLMAHGLNPRTPVSVIEWGTLPRQRTCTGNLITIASAVQAMRLGPPCLIVVGDVVGLSKRLNWFERLPLFGRRVLVTRMSEKSAALRDELEMLGADVAAIPTIRIEPPDDYRPLDREIRHLRDYDWIVLTSAFGVEHFMRRFLRIAKDVRRLSGIRIAAVGPETSRALLNHGLKPDLMPARFETAELLKLLKKRLKGRPGARVLLPRTDIAPPLLETGLKRLGAKPTRVTAYRTRMPQKEETGLLRGYVRGGADIVTFTSSSTAEHFVKILGLSRARALSRSASFVSIGPVTTRTLKRLGCRVAGTASVYSMQGLTEAILRAARKERN